jgi:tetratricopeptide (TPR) repeat protein
VLTVNPCKIGKEAVGFSSAEKPPATALQAARQEIGWKQVRTRRELRQAATREGLTIATEASLKTMLSRWENGHEHPDAMYQRLFCQIYRATADDLGFGIDDMPQVLRIAPKVDATMVDYFRDVMFQHIRADNLMGPHHLVDVVRAQVELLDQVLTDARGDIRADLLYLGGRYNELTGWLYQDAGDTDNAMRYTDRAMDHALELGDACVAAYFLMRKANIAIDAGRPDRALGLTEAALRDPKQVPPRIRALLLGQRGRAHARLAEPAQCARALEQAQREAGRLDDASIGLASYCTPSYVAMEAASCWSQLGHFDNAIATYEVGLGSWPDGYRRDQGLCLARLAGSHAGREDVQSACEIGKRAIEVVQTATSSRALQELQRLRVRLAPWRRDAGVSELSERIRTMIRPAR